MSKHNIYLLALGIITILCIIAGSIINLGNFSHFYTYSDEEEDFSESVLLEDFDSIQIKGKVLGITIRTGNTASLKIKSNREKLIPDAYVNEKELIISQNNTGHFHGHSACSIFLTVPENKTLRNIDIKVNVGDIKLYDVLADFIDIETNVGQIELSDIIFRELEGETNVGEVTLKGLKQSGNIKDFDIELETNIGEVSVGGRKYKKSYEQKGYTEKEINLYTNVGKIKIM